MLRIFELLEDGNRIDYQKYIDEDTLPPHIDRLRIPENSLHIPVPIEEIQHALQMHREVTVAEGKLHYSIVAGRDETLEGLVAGVRPDAFQYMLSQFIDRYWRMTSQRGYACVYNEAGISRQLFSTMFAYGRDYTPRKENIYRLAVVLKLSLPEARRLMDAKGYSISPNDRFDVIMKYCIEHHIADKNKIDGYLFEYCRRTLFSIQY